MQKKVINFNPLTDLIDRGVGQMRLVRTDAMESITEFCPEFLCPIYNSKDKIKTIYASVLKAAFLQRRACFLLSRRELDKLVKADSDNRYKSVNEKDYTGFYIHIIGNGILSYVVEPSDLAGIAALVSFNEEILKGLYQLENPEHYEFQIAKSLEIYQKKLDKLIAIEERKQKRKLEKEARQNPERKSRQ